MSRKKRKRKIPKLCKGCGVNSCQRQRTYCSMECFHLHGKNKKAPTWSELRTNKLWLKV